MGSSCFIALILLSLEVVELQFQSCFDFVAYFEGFSIDYILSEWDLVLEKAHGLSHVMNDGVFKRWKVNFSELIRLGKSARVGFNSQDSGSVLAPGVDGCLRHLEIIRNGIITPIFPMLPFIEAQ